MKRMKVFFARLADVLDDWFAYVLTAAGVWLSMYGPALQAGTPIRLEWGRIVLSAAIAFTLVGKQEFLPTQDQIARIGRRRWFITRMSNALMQGWGWAQAAPLVMKAIGLG